MFFHGIIFTKQGQSHRPTGRGAGSRAATRKPLILLADSIVRTLGRGPGARGRARRRAGGSARTWADIDVGGPGIDGQGIVQGIARGSPGDRQGIDGGGPGRTFRGPADQPGRGSISGQGPGARGQESVRRFHGSRARAQGPGFTKNGTRAWAKKRPARIDPGGPVGNAPDANSASAGGPQRRPPVYCI